MFPWNTMLYSCCQKTVGSVNISPTLWYNCQGEWTHETRWKLTPCVTLSRRSVGCVTNHRWAGNFTAFPQTCIELKHGYVTYPTHRQWMFRDQAREFTNHLILATVAVDPEPILGKLDIRQEYTLNGEPVYHKAVLTHQALILHPGAI